MRTELSLMYGLSERANFIVLIKFNNFDTNNLSNKICI
jgi:hypothetical protein